MTNLSLGDPKTLVELLRLRGAEMPQRAAYTFLPDGESVGETLTFGEVEERARALASHLQMLGASGERALLLFPQCVEYIIAFYGCLMAGVVAVPAYPPRQNRNLSRVEGILDDCQPRVVLTQAAVQEKVERLFGDHPRFQDLRWVAIEDVPRGLSDTWKDPGVGPDDLAFLQYTSGSTSSPKGVMVSHRNLLHNSFLLDHGWRHDDESVLVSWLPIFHDLGLIYGVLQPLYRGIHGYMMAPVAFLQRPFRWLHAISRFRASHSLGPNFAYQLSVERITEEECAELDLSSWAVAVTGAEPVRKETFDRFIERFAPCGFRPEAVTPGYGLAEATLKVTASQRGEMPTYLEVEAEALEQHRLVPAGADGVETRTLAACGAAEADVKIRISQPETGELAAADEVGEIWVAGPSITQGYWRRPEATAETFVRLPGEDQVYLRTGDLGFVYEGQLYITGRIKDLVIIHGRNHYPQDIEHTAESSHPLVRSGCSAAFSVDMEGEERLVIVAEVGGRGTDLDTTEVVEAIRRKVIEEHEIPVHALTLVRAQTIPKTSSGKIQRRACRADYLGGQLRELASWSLASEPGARRRELDGAGGEPLGRRILALGPDERLGAMQEELRRAVAWVLGLAEEEVDLGADLAALGMDSVRAIEVCARLETELEIPVATNLLWRRPTLGKLGEELLEQLLESALDALVGEPQPVTPGGEADSEVEDFEL